MTQKIDTQNLVIGGGLAGLSLALRLADAGQHVTILAKRELGEGSTRYAQGGIAAVLSDDDSFEYHINDTHVAGAGLCDPKAVEMVVKNAPQAVKWLIKRGVSFTLLEDGNGGEYHLTKEGGHSHRRVIHAADATGAEVEGTLEQIVRKHPNIALLENHIAIDLITTEKLGLSTDNNLVLGVYALNLNSKTPVTISARQIVLATGGASKVYLYTSNPDTSTGDGIAMAWRAGCRIANMEFVQFHPTCLYHPHAKSFLISEALRGEGAHLIHADGQRFMLQHDQRAELAPRDIVARTIDFEMKKNGYDCVYLDISHQSEDFILHHFPTISARCKEFGFDLSKQPIPVVPSAHYTCGGILTNLNGQTDIANLYAIGETSCTGLHGANRLASNSLLECLVYADAAATHILTNKNEQFSQEILPYWDESQVADPDERIVVSHNWDELRRCMWDYVGIVRTDKRLQRAQNRIDMLKEEVIEYYSNFKVTNDLIELRNILDVADLIVKSAIARKESRGLHYTLDYPDMDDNASQFTIIQSPSSA